MRLRKQTPSYLLAKKKIHGKNGCHDFRMNSRLFKHWSVLWYDIKCYENNRNPQRWILNVEQNHIYIYSSILCSKWKISCNFSLFTCLVSSRSSFRIYHEYGFTVYMRQMKIKMFNSMVSRCVRVDGGWLREMQWNCNREWWNVVISCWGRKAAPCYEQKIIFIIERIWVTGFRMAKICMKIML